VVLSRPMAAEGWYPAVNILDSISRLMPAVISVEHRRKASLVRRLLAAYARSEDLVRIGAYKAGADPELDQALKARPVLRAFLTQESGERISLADCVARLQALDIGT
jgi:flagellum-specific ATP synthase